jgi:DNA-binding SARP family transcriptional activator
MGNAQQTTSGAIFRLNLGVLGPLEAWLSGGQPVLLGPPRQRAVLGMLALSPNILVHREEIIDRLWPDCPPATAVDLVQAYVSRLRGALAPASPVRSRRALVASLGASYRLQLEPDELDLTVFLRAAGRADAAAAAADHAGACDLYDQALRLWRGRPLADLGEQRAAVVMRYASAAASAGQPGRVLPQLQLLAEQEPLDERVHAALMTALASGGQQAAALAVYAGLTARLDDQLGVRPGPGLVEAHLRVLRQDLVQLKPGAATARKPAPVVPRQLPPGPRPFHGRGAEQQALADLAAEPFPAGPPPVAVISGPAGAGKTALALHWAALAAERFPEGQVYVNFRGPDGEGDPVPSAELLGSLLRSLPGAPPDLPDGLETRTNLYRSLVAGRNLLIVLDQASSARQVRPLLPGLAGGLVIVTSQSRLAGLAAVYGARLIHLAPLTAADSLGLIRARLGADRVQAEPAAARRLAELCDGLPLALSLAAARAMTRPGEPLAALAAELSDESAQLDTLDSMAPADGLRAAFARPYRSLGPAAAHAFRSLGRCPRRDITASGLASLAGLPLRQAQAALRDLADLSLVTEPAPGRFAVPGLLQRFAAEVACARSASGLA